MACRICLEPENLISVCGCKGTMGFVHKDCIDKWKAINLSNTCELCSQRYKKQYTINGAGIFYLFMGSFTTFVHAFLIYKLTESLSEPIYSSIVCCFFMLGVYTILLYILQLFDTVYTIIACYLWPVTFFSISVIFQYDRMEFDRPELHFNYILFCIYFTVLCGKVNGVTTKNRCI